MDGRYLKIVEESVLEKELSSIIESIATESIRSNGIFNVGFSGGSIVQLLDQCLPQIKTSWKQWRIFFCDERVVSFDSPDSTYGLYKNTVMKSIPISENQFIKVKPDLPASDAANDYENQLRSHFHNQLPRFDLLILGLGPDGHTCSLFPGHILLNETNLWVAPITDSPKPPPSRITLTYPVINNTKNCLFVASGKSKSGVLKRIFTDKEDLPASRVQPTSGKLVWLVDEAAASEIITS